jgi:fructan beta-fructosidase
MLLFANDGPVSGLQCVPHVGRYPPRPTSASQRAAATWAGISETDAKLAPATCGFLPRWIMGRACGWGEYHLFFQYNPYGWRWANMHGGHAVSKDLVHWEELSTALVPWTQAVAHCFSGSAVVDERNTAGFQAGDEKTIVAAFTDTGCGEAIAFSTSPNLKDWEYESRLDGFYECPELFELPVDGDPANTRWVAFAADAKYVLGRFDGETFTPEHEGKHQVHWGAFYASQLFTGAPDGRHIQIGWGRINMDGMPFNQMMTFPCELTLRTTDEGLRMLAAPVKEIELLHQRKHALQAVQVRPGESVTVATRGRLFDIRAEFEVGRGLPSACKSATP